MTVMYRNARRGQSRWRAWLRRQFARRPRPVWMLIVMDILLIGISLVVFALFHHVLPRSEASTGIVSSRYQNQADAPADDTAALPAAVTATEPPLAISGPGAAEPGDTQAADTQAVEAAYVQPAEAEATAEPLPAAPLGYFGDKFPELFTDGKVHKTNDSYRSGNVNISLHQYEYDESVVYLADIYIKDIECFKTAFAEDRFGQGISERQEAINKRARGILAVNGDYYGARKDGVVIRNGELYRDKKVTMDVCVLYWDGTIETYSKSEFDAREAMENGAYQAWHFGPRLLDSEGKPMRRFSNASLGPRNPRTVLGYYEPGHYCFVVVDGRSNASEGLTIKVLAKLMSQLGCKRAYNMDGGGTSTMLIGDKVVNNPSGGGRNCSDIILITERT